MVHGGFGVPRGDLGMTYITGRPGFNAPKWGRPDAGREPGALRQPSTALPVPPVAGRTASAARRGQRRPSGTVTSPCRQRAGPSSSGQPAAQRPYRRDPALPRAERGERRRRRPRAVEVGQERVHRLPRHVAVDQRLRQPFGQVGGPVQRAEPGREGHRARALRAERHPHVAPPDLVAGPLDQQPAGRQPRRTAGAQTARDLRPRRTAAARSRPGSARAAGRRAAGPRSRRAGRRSPGRGVRQRRRRPARVDLDADDLGVRPYGAQPGQQFDRGPRRGAVAEVDGDRVGGAAQRARRGRPRSSGPCGAAGWGWWCRGSPPRPGVAAHGARVTARAGPRYRARSARRRAVGRCTASAKRKWNIGVRCSGWLVRRGVSAPDGTRHASARPRHGRTATTQPVRRAAASHAPRRTPGGRLRRVAMLSVHTSPLHQPGTGDAGGMNVYIVELAKRLAEHRHRGRDLHPGHHRRPAAARSSWPPASWSGTSTPARTRGWPRRTCPAQLCAFTHGVMRAEAGAAPGLLRPGALALLAVRPGRLAGRRALGRAAGARHAHHGQGQERRARRGRRPRAGRPGHRRDAGRRRRRPADRQHRRGGRRAGARTTTPARAKVAVVHPGRQPRPLPPAATAGPPPGPGSACRRTRSIPLFVGPHPAAEGARRAAARGRRPAGRATPRCATGWSCRSSAVPAAPAWPSRTRLHKLAARLGIADVVRFQPPVGPGAARRLVPGGDRAGHAVVQRVLRAGRDRGAGVRHAGRRGGGRRAAGRGARRA